MERYRVRLAYDGTDFHGSQVQPELRTVQGEVERVLAQISGSRSTVYFAGRTDAGVHASGQEIAFDLTWKHSESDLQRALNSQLPWDIAAVQVSRTGKDFHPRYDAGQRRYVYSLRVSEHRDPLQYRYQWRVRPPLHLDRMEEASRLLKGIHDFGAFGRPHQEGRSTVRRIDRAEWRREGDHFQFYLVGNAFLYHMVRHIVIVLVEIGQEKRAAQEVQQLLDRPHGPPAQGLAPARGLRLDRVIYPGELDEEL
jgi:tRNA pseudouridine38-40 synthase